MQTRTHTSMHAGLYYFIHRRFARLIVFDMGSLPVVLHLVVSLMMEEFVRNTVGCAKQHCGAPSPP